MPAAGPLLSCCPHHGSHVEVVHSHDVKQIQVVFQAKYILQGTDRQVRLGLLGPYMLSSALT